MNRYRNLNEQSERMFELMGGDSMLNEATTVPGPPGSDVNPAPTTVAAPDQPSSKNPPAEPVAATNDAPVDQTTPNGAVLSVGSKYMPAEKDKPDVTADLGNGTQIRKGAKYAIVDKTKDVLRLDSNGIITAIFKRNESITESISNRDVSKLLIPAHILYNEINEAQYKCIGDCGKQDIMGKSFTETVEKIINGEKIPAKVTKPSVVSDTANPADEIQKIILEISDSIRLLFSNTDFWKPFKNSAAAGVLRTNDDEEGAAEELKKWWSTDSGNAGKLEKAKTELLPKVSDESQKSICQKNINILTNSIVNTNSTNSLITKLLGDTTDDSFRWSITLLSGEVKTYEVDTDF